MDVVSTTDGQPANMVMSFDVTIPATILTAPATLRNTVSAGLADTWSGRTPMAFGRPGRSPSTDAR